MDGSRPDPARHQYIRGWGIGYPGAALSIASRSLTRSFQLASYRAMAGYVYLMTNVSRHPIYCGVTSDLVRRVYEHRESLIPNAYTSRYRMFRLVYYEVHGTMPLAIQREKNIKHWSRAWKIALIEEMNADRRDLWDEIVKSPF